jgi:hypothetical protein
MVICSDRGKSEAKMGMIGSPLQVLNIAVFNIIGC